MQNKNKNLHFQYGLILILGLSVFCFGNDVRAQEMANDLTGQTSGKSVLDVQLQKGEETDLVFFATNTGESVWENTGEKAVELGTIEPLDKSSRLFLSGWWENDHRPGKLVESKVGNGETGSFSVKIKVPNDALPGEIISEKYWLVTADNQWLERTASQFFAVNVKVVKDLKNDYQEPQKISTENIVEDRLDLNFSDDFERKEIFVDRGDDVNLIWNSENADYCRAEDGWGGDKATKNGKEKIRNIQTNSFLTLICGNEANRVSEKIIIKVNDPPTGSLEKSECNAKNRSIFLSGYAIDNRDNGKELQINIYLGKTDQTKQFIGKTFTNFGNWNFAVNNNDLTLNSVQKIYVYVVDNDNGQEYLIGSKNRLICGIAEPIAPLIELRINDYKKTEIFEYNTPITIAWKAENAMYCQSDWSSKTSLSGSETIFATQDRKFIIKCFNGNLATNAEVDLKVTKPEYRAEMKVDKNLIRDDGVDFSTIEFALFDKSGRPITDKEIWIEDKTMLADGTKTNNRWKYLSNKVGKIFVYNIYNPAKGDQLYDELSFEVEGQKLGETKIEYFHDSQNMIEPGIYSNKNQIEYEADELMVTVFPGKTDVESAKYQQIKMLCWQLSANGDDFYPIYFAPINIPTGTAKFFPYQKENTTGANRLICSYQVDNIASNKWQMIDFSSQTPEQKYDGKKSMFVADKKSISKDKEETTTITLILKDKNGNPLPAGMEVDFAYGTIYTDQSMEAANFNNKYLTDEQGKIELKIKYDSTTKKEYCATTVSYSVDGVPSNQWLEIKYF
ncbi:MAG: hypothetical protein ACOZAR_00015 [Patescibacteria group bacterium]